MTFKCPMFIALFFRASKWRKIKNCKIKNSHCKIKNSEVTKQVSSAQTQVFSFTLARQIITKHKVLWHFIGRFCCEGLYILRRNSQNKNIFAAETAGSSSLHVFTREHMVHTRTHTGLTHAEGNSKTPSTHAVQLCKHGRSHARIYLCLHLTTPTTLSKNESTTTRTHRWMRYISCESWPPRWQVVKPAEFSLLLFVSIVNRSAGAPWTRRFKTRVFGATQLVNTQVSEASTYTWKARGPTLVTRCEAHRWRDAFRLHFVSFVFLHYREK